MAPEYVIKKTAVKPELEGLWDGLVWRHADELSVNHFHPRSSSHHPITHARLLYDAEWLYVIFQVQDRYVRCTRTDYQASVCKDACVEFFVQPKSDSGYFNFEVNAIGTLLLSYVEDWTRAEDGFAKCTPVPWRQASAIAMYHSLKGIVYPELEDKAQWTVEYAIPRGLLEAYVGLLGDWSGQTWRGNFYKCADESSHVHWGSWSPIGEELNFHQPRYFAPLHFEG